MDRVFRFPILIFILFLFNSLCGQTTIDSLEQSLQKASSDKIRCDILHELSFVMINEDPGKAAEYANKALTLAKKINYKDGEGLALFDLGNVGYYQDDYEYGLKKLDEAEKIFLTTKNNKGLGFVFNCKGQIQILEGEYSNALKSLAEAMKYFESIKNTSGMAQVDIDIGSIHYYQKNYNEAIKYFNQALQSGDEVRIGGASVFLGFVYVDQNNYSEAKKHVEVANKIGIKTQDNYILSDCLYLLGRIDFFYGDLKSAEEKFLASLKIQEELENFQGITQDCNYLGMLNLNNKNIDKAIEYYRKAYLVAADKGIKEEQKNASLGLSNSFNFIKLYDSAYYYLKVNHTISEELLSEDASKKLAELEASLAAQKREAEVESERKVQAFTKKVIIFSGIGLLLVMITISYILYNRNKLKQKANQKLAAINKEIEHQRDIIEEKHKEITDSINYAERIQRSMLASKKLLDEQLMGEDSYFILFKPKDVVSGDFYWASKLANGNFAMVTADSTGHGVPGSIMSMLNMNSLKEAVKMDLSQPADILNYTRKVIIDTLANDGSKEGGKDGMDCCCLVYDMKNKKLSFAAAHNPVWIIRGTEVLEYKSDKMPVGKHDRQDTPFTQHDVDLQTGDMVYALTDGYPDQFGGEKGKKFMSKNLRELLIANAHLSLKEQKDLLDKIFTGWVGNLEQVDDVTIMGVRIS
ncbi:MAG: SpoIIE family protein phosphatase [Bacteroidota bacterium]|nr:SpoIIE family protein phosphatase [Bacteroidota bacterium]